MNMCEETDEEKIEENESEDHLLNPEVQNLFAEYYQDFRLSVYSEDEDDGEGDAENSNFVPESQPSTFKSKMASNKVHDISMNGSAMQGLIEKSPASKKKV